MTEDPVAEAAAGREELLSVFHTLGLVPTGLQVQQLLDYLALLLRWNRVYNLTAVRDHQSMLSHHLADCLAVIGPLQHQIAAGRVLDVGSGAGLPGVVVAVMFPECQVSCVDTVGKKAAFIRQVAATLSLPNLKAEHSRVEALREPPYRLITARAFASLLQFTRLTRQHLEPGGVWMAMKGQLPDDEIAELPQDIEVFHVEHLNVPNLPARRCLVWMRPREAN
jgi:16S rRNA (guanine527-N7)-methyltransferase